MRGNDDDDVVMWLSSALYFFVVRNTEDEGRKYVVVGTAGFCSRSSESTMIDFRGVSMHSSCHTRSYFVPTAALYVQIGSGKRNRVYVYVPVFL